MQLLIFSVILPEQMRLVFFCSIHVNCCLRRSSSKCLSLYRECSHEEQLRAKRWLSSVEFVSGTHLALFLEAESSEQYRAPHVKNGFVTQPLLHGLALSLIQEVTVRWQVWTLMTSRWSQPLWLSPGAHCRACADVRQCVCVETVMYMCLVWTVQHGRSPVGAAAGEEEEEVGVTHRGSHLFSPQLPRPQLWSPWKGISNFPFSKINEIRPLHWGAMKGPVQVHLVQHCHDAYFNFFKNIYPGSEPCISMWWWTRSHGPYSQGTYTPMRELLNEENAGLRTPSQ